MIAISRNRLQCHLRSTLTLTSHSKMISNQSISISSVSISTCTRSLQQSQSQSTSSTTNPTKVQSQSQNGSSHFSKNRMNNTKLNLKPAPIRPAAKSTSTSTSTSTTSSSDSSPTSSTKSNPDSISASMNKSVSTTTSQSSTSSPISTHTTTSTSPPSTSISTTEKSEDPTPPPSSPPQGQSLAEKAKSFIYTLRLFFRFYFRGVKQIWWDSRKISEIRKRSRLQMQQGGKMSLEEAKREVSDKENVDGIIPSRARGIKWSEAAMIRSHHHDLLCLPLFLILLVLLEEAIPLIVIFAPALLPTTCLLESQREGIRRREEVKRSLAWERLTGSNLDLQKEKEKVREEVKVKDWKLEGLSLENLRDFSHIFSLPSYGPSFLLRHRLRKRLEFLQKDDILLLEASKEPASSPDGMSTEREVLAKAAGERGLRASGISSTALRDSLFSYLTKISSGSSEDGIPSTLSLSVPISLYDTTDLTSLRKVAQEQASRGVFAQAKDVMNSVLKEEKEREVREKEKKEAEEKENERKN